ncbi:MAG: hypothetical protein Q9183_002251 [Haloplaca sp. 2 TL-2023]
MAEDTMHIVRPPLSHPLFWATRQTSLMLAGDGQYWGPNDDQANSLDPIADFAEAYPNTATIATDLSPVWPDTKPSNLSFEIDDCCSDWVYPKNSLDYIHVRQLYGSVADWPAFYKECYE